MIKDNYAGKAIFDYRRSLVFMPRMKGVDADHPRGEIRIYHAGKAGDTLTHALRSTVPYHIPDDADMLIAEPRYEAGVVMVGARAVMNGVTRYAGFGVMTERKVMGPWAEALTTLSTTDVQWFFDEILKGVLMYYN